MGWPCQLPLRVCLYMRSQKWVRAAVLVFLLVFYCEFLHYFLVLLSCTWPSSELQHLDPSVPAPSPHARPLRALVLGDTHILGFREGHWFDKLRREWQMQRSFRTTMMLHSPDIVFILGDLTDEGKWCSDAEFKYHAERFGKMFAVPSHTAMHVVVGNHDVGFHYTMTEAKHHRFEKAFGAPAVQLLDVKGNFFVLINSMALEGDGCSLCRKAVADLQEISTRLKCGQGYPKIQPDPSVCSKYKSFVYSRPIILQHFPMYRASDENCSTPDAAPPEEKFIRFRPRWDCLSKEATGLLFDWLDPRLVLTAHTHHGCHRLHKNGVPEWTVASFSWRNKQNPSFLLVSLQQNSFAVSQCLMPDERTVLTIYITGGLLIVFSLLVPQRGHKPSSNKLH